jgi:hypothetical protein
MPPPQPGNFLLSTASLGSHLVTSLLTHIDITIANFSLITNISLTNTFLTQSGTQINLYPTYFKDSFQTTFEPIISETQKLYEVLQKALEIIDCEKRGPVCGIQGSVLKKPPKEGWKKVMWALEMQGQKSVEWLKEFEKVMQRAWILRCLVPLVILQKKAQL